MHTSGLLLRPDSTTIAATEEATVAIAVAAAAIARVPRTPPHQPGAAQPPGSAGQQLSATPSTVTAASALIHSEIHLQPHY